MAKKSSATETTKLGNKVSGEKNRKKTKKTLSPEEIARRKEQRERFRFAAGCVVLVIALFFLVAFFSYLNTGAEDSNLIEAGEMKGFENYAGAIGAHCGHFFINRCFGISALLIPVFFTVLGLKLMRAYKVRLWKWFLNCCFLTIWFSVSMSFFFSNLFEGLKEWSFINPGGNHGRIVSEWLSQTVGPIGTFMTILITIIIYMVYLSQETIVWLRKILNPFASIKSALPKRQHAENTPERTEEGPYETPEPQIIDFGVSVNEEEQARPATATPHERSVETADAVSDAITDDDSPNNISLSEDDENPIMLDIVETKEEETANEDGTGTLEPYDPKLDLENYRYPTLELLDRREEGGAPIDMEEQNKNKDHIIEVLQNFGVDISSIKATVGPTITLYEITPAKGVRISKIKNLEDDIALSLSALGIRIIAPIPGKGTIGIEVPNARPQMVSMESILNSKKFQETDFELPIALGKTITNEVYMVDLAKMPHLLVAGATGQGKSVGLNAIITSLLYKKHPAELKFVMVDPKKVEFSVYSPIENHFLAKIAEDEGESIITDVQKVVATLKSLCAEMDNRYDLLKKVRARNIKEYNAKFTARQLNPQHGHRFLPYIVVIIDEFGDLIMTAGKEIELPIARIAQLARAVGIHMIIATQRPTTNIITGTIKANFPARMAFKVSAMIDSRTILDRTGANQLIGRGDMLFLAGSDPVRVQCAFVDTPEVERITAYIAKQQSYLGPFDLPKVEMEGMDSGDSGNVDMTHLDPLFEEAARLIVASQQGSTSMIQRKFSIGYNRAGRLMDQLEQAGIVGPAIGSKPRDVLCIDDNDLEMRMNNLR